MNPATITGVVAAALDFFKFLIGIVKIFLEIYKDFKGATAANKKLEAKMRGDTRVELAGLTVEDANESASTKSVRNIAVECKGIEASLLRVLAHVRGAGRPKPLSTVKATYRAFKAKKTIDQLQQKLQESRERLETTIILEMRGRTEPALIELSHQVAQSGTRLQYQVTTLLAFRKEVADQNERILRELSSLETRVNEGLANTNGVSTSDQLLRSLFFPEYASRREQIHDAWPETFGWIFDQKINVPTTWPSFPEWLQSGESLYWLSGKAGSGKSTLMGYLLANELTLEHLKVWADIHSLHIVSFFFWKPGSHLQRSVVGLLRAVLYQLAERVPSLADRLLKDFSLHPDRLPEWTERRLGEMIQAALQSEPEQMLCLFLDGLDEFEGDIDKLMDVVLKLGSFAHVKLCVSSRPETRISQRLSSSIRLRLEDLNRDDIRIFVTTKLTSTGQSSQPLKNYARRITSGAGGVFLWASLITQSIVNGLVNDDDEYTISRRIEMAPKGMNELFGHMLHGVDGVYKKSLAYLLRVMEISGKPAGCGGFDRPNVALVAASKMTGDIFPLQPFLRTCEQVQRQVTTQSNGLLELSGTYLGGYPRTICGKQVKHVPEPLEKAWLVSQEGSSQCVLSSGSSSEQILAVKRITACDSTSRQLLEYQRTTITWVHRSAFEFVFETGVPEVACILNLADTKVVASDFLKAHIKLLVAAPLLVKEFADQDMSENSLPQIDSIWRSILRSIARAQSLTGSTLASNIDELRAVVDSIYYHFPWINNGDGGYRLNFSLHEHLSSSAWGRTRTRQCSYWALFWRACVGAGLVSYVLEHLDAISRHHDQGLSLAVVTSGCSQRYGLASDQLITVLRAMQQTLENNCLPTAGSTHTRLFPLFPVSDYGMTRDNTWMDDISCAVEDDMIFILIDAFHSWTEVHLQDMKQEQEAGRGDAKASALDAQVAQLFASLLERWNTYTTRWSLPYPSRGRFLIQHPAAYFVLHDAGAPSIISDTPPKVRIVCTRVNAHGTVVLIAKHDVDSSLALLIYKCGLSDEATRERLIDDVWVNKDEKLDAWQQLYLLACLRTCRIDRKRRVVRNRPQYDREELMMLEGLQLE